MKWTNKIEEDVESIYKIITKTTNEVGKLLDTTRKPKRHYWFTTEVRDARAEVRKLFRRAKRQIGKEGYEQAYTTYKQSNTKYRTLAEKARKKCWRDFVSDNVNDDHIYTLNKMLKSNCKYNLGMMKDSNGITVRSPEDSLEILIYEHFKGCTEGELTGKCSNITYENMEGLDWINEYKLEEAIKKIKDKNGTGNRRHNTKSS